MYNVLFCDEQRRHSLIIYRLLLQKPETRRLTRRISTGLDIPCAERTQ